jgi:hypothetical protein
MAETLDFCFDRYPEGEGYEPEALPDPVDLRNASHEELAMAWRKNWQPGQEIRIAFMDGDPELQQKVQEVASRWLEHANLDFNFGNHADAEIRVSFQGRGYWSLIGTDSSKVPSHEPTLQLGGYSLDMPEEKFRRPVLHEFGHAIGCIHEQASPAVRIPWDEQKVYEWYREHQGWSDDEIYHNVLRRYTEEETRFTEHDPESIMQYPVPEELTVGNYSIGWNTDLSEQDKSFIARMYPRSGAVT